MKAVEAIAVAGVVVFLVILAKDGDADFERLVKRAEMNERIASQCVPMGGETVTMQWIRGELVCRIWSTSRKHHAAVDFRESSVATTEDFLQ